MANILAMEKKISIIGALAEGQSIRATERMLGVHRDTIMRLGVSVGQGCERLLDSLMRNLTCEKIQIDEIWGYVGMHQRHVRNLQEGDFAGDAWTFISIDADTKLVPNFRVGKRDNQTARAFVADLAGRLNNRCQLSTDRMFAYIEAVEMAFGSNVDYGQIVKSYDQDDQTPASRRYSTPGVVSVERSVVKGQPAFEHISTSYIEKQNLTLRTHCRRMARLTNAFSKKLENFKAAIALHFGYYNLVKRHGTIRMTPALKAGVVNKLWSTADLVEAALSA
jgi:IS1 family transposase